MAKYDVNLDGVNRFTVEMPERVSPAQIKTLLNLHDDAEIVEWKHGVDPKLPTHANRNVCDIELSVVIDRNENRFEEIARFVDEVREQNMSVPDSEIYLEINDKMSDHEVVTLVVPKKRY